MVSHNADRTQSARSGKTTKKKAVAKKTTLKTTGIGAAKVASAAKQAATSARKETKRRGQWSAGVTEEQIRKRAYEIFMARGGLSGDAVSDWVQAERELSREM